MMKSGIHRPGTCRPKTQMATQRCFLSELCADSRCSLSIVNGEMKGTLTWHLPSKNTNGDTNMLPVKTMCKLKMFTVNSWWWNQGYIDLAPVVQKHKWRHKYASCQNYAQTQDVSLSIVDGEIKDTSTWHLSSKNTNGYTKMLRFRTIMWQNYKITKSDDKFNTTLPKMITTNSFADSHTHTHTHTHTHKHTKKHTQTHTQLQQYWWQSWRYTNGQSLMTIFQHNHHFCGTLGSLWWQSLKDEHQCSRTLGSLWWESWGTTITSAELWAVFDDDLWRHHHKNTRTPQKHKNTKTPPQKKTQKHHSENTATPPQKTPPHHHKNTTTKKQPHHQHHHHHHHHKQNTSTPPQKHNTSTKTPPQNHQPHHQHHHHHHRTPQTKHHHTTTTKTPPQHHHKNTTTKAPPQKHHKNVHFTTKTPPHHHKNTTKTPPQKHHHTTTKTPRPVQNVHFTSVFHRSPVQSGPKRPFYLSFPP